MTAGIAVAKRATLATGNSRYFMDLSIPAIKSLAASAASVDPHARLQAPKMVIDEVLVLRCCRSKF
jgi:hypothetical protein